MSFLLVIWGWEMSDPKFYGLARPPYMLGPDATILERSMSMKCENCQAKGDMDIFETHRNWHIYHLIPLGTSEHRYHIHCKRCGAFLVTLDKTDINFLRKKGLVFRENDLKNL